MATRSCKSGKSKASQKKYRAAECVRKLLAERDAKVAVKEKGEELRWHRSW